MSAGTTRSTRTFEAIMARAQSDPCGAARELGRALMRGNRQDHKLGYSARSATIAAAETVGLDPAYNDLLTTHLIGFALGMDEDAESVYPAGI